MSMLSNLKIKSKFRIPIAFQLIILLAIVIFYFSYDSLITQENARGTVFSGVLERTRDLSGSIDDFLHGEKTYQQFKSEYDAVLQAVQESGIYTDQEKLAEWNVLDKELKTIDGLVTQNKTSEKEIFLVFDSAVKGTNTFFEQLRGKLQQLDRSVRGVPVRKMEKDETSRVKRNLINRLPTEEQRAIATAGAGLNTFLKINELFQQARKQPDQVPQLMSFMESALKEAEASEQQLAGSAYAQMPTQIKESVARIKGLVETYVANANTVKTSAATIDTELQGIFEYLDSTAADRKLLFLKEARTVFYRLFILLVLVTVVLIILNITLGNTITKHVISMTARAYDLAVGDVDMTQRLAVESGDEVGELAGWFNKFLERLQQLVEKVKQSSKEVYEATEEIASNSENLAVRTNQQAASLTETSATLAEFTTSVQNNTENSAEADMMLADFNAEIQEKSSLIDDVTRTMSEIYESSKEIDNIIKVINDISFQTNLLALNAAVEAARAGEAGRGFAVVASEVRNLAQKTAESSKSIQEIVIRNVESTQRGTELVNDTSKFFGEIVGVMGETVQKIAEITDASRHQSTGIEQINTAISQMDEVSSHNANLVDQLSSTGKSVKSNTLELQELMSQFKTDASSDIKGSDYFEEVLKQKDTKEKEEKQKATVSKPAESPKTGTAKKERKKAASEPTTSKPTPTEDDFFGGDDDGFEEF